MSDKNKLPTPEEAWYNEFGLEPTGNELFVIQQYARRLVKYTLEQAAGAEQKVGISESIIFNDSQKHLILSLEEEIIKQLEL